MFDLYIYPFGYKNQKEYSNLAGYFVGNVQRKATRTRAEDVIVIRFTAFKELLETEVKELNLLISLTASFFYKTKGPITTAAKKSGEFFNNKLSQLNVKNNTRPAIVGSLHFLVQNKDDLFIMQSGGSTSFYFSQSNIERFEEKKYGVEGIGFGKTINLRFFHSKINGGDRLILCAKTPAYWNQDTFKLKETESISQIRRTLINLSQDNFEAIVIQFRQGNGNVHQLKLDSSEVRSPFSEKESEKEQNHFSSEPIAIPVEKIEETVSKEENKELQIEVEPFDVGLNNEEAFLEAENQEFDSLLNENDDHQNQMDIFEFNPDEKKEEARRQVQSQSPEDVQESQKIKELQEQQESIFLSGKKLGAEKPVVIPKKRGKKKSDAFALFLVKTRQNFRKWNQKFDSIKDQAKKFLIKNTKASTIGESKDPNSLSSGSMLMIAILVAVFVSAIGIAVYLRSGITSQKTDLLANANLLINDALEEKDSSNQILMFQEALRLIGESEKFGEADDTLEVREFVESQLDHLQGVTRINIQPTVFGGLDKRLQIKRMGIHMNGDVYALDTGMGRVLRMIPTRPDYVVDTAFKCGPGKYGDVIVDSLVDIEVINYSNKFNITLLGIDRYGKLLMCIQGNDPIAIDLWKPDSGWGEIRAIGFNGYSLYVLDAGVQTRDIYRYPANEYQFDQNPESLFRTNIPDNVVDSLDIAVNQEELYLLHEDGQLTRCNLNQLSCENNVGYGIIREGKSRENLDVIPDTQFSQVVVTAPPDPSIYFLNLQNQSIYHFSMALNLQKQIRPSIEGLSNFDKSKELSSFAVSPNGIIHFSFGNQLYFGYLP